MTALNMNMEAVAAAAEQMGLSSHELELLGVGRPVTLTVIASVSTALQIPLQELIVIDYAPNESVPWWADEAMVSA